MAEKVIITRAGQNFIDHLSRAYNLTLRAYEDLVEAQEGRCAVCRNEPPAGERLHIDHDHHTREVRGLLCGRCNSALGQMREDPALICELAAYAVRAAELREVVRRQPRSVLGVGARTRHPLTQVFERVPDKTRIAQGIVSAVAAWQRGSGQQWLQLASGVEEFWPTTPEERAMRES